MIIGKDKRERDALIKRVDALEGELFMKDGLILELRHEPRHQADTITSLRELSCDLECELGRFQASASKQTKAKVDHMREARTGYTPEEYAKIKPFAHG